MSETPCPKCHRRSSYRYICQWCLEPLGQKHLFIRNLTLFVGGFVLFQGLAIALRGCQ